MKNLTKKQKEIIAYCLALLENDCEVKSTKIEMHKLISMLQKEGIFGMVEFNN